ALQSRVATDAAEQMSECPIAVGAEKASCSERIVPVLVPWVDARLSSRVRVHRHEEAAVRDRTGKRRRSFFADDVALGEPLRRVEGGQCAPVGDTRQSDREYSSGD